MGLRAPSLLLRLGSSRMGGSLLRRRIASCLVASEFFEILLAHACGVFELPWIEKVADEEAVLFAMK